LALKIFGPYYFGPYYLALMAVTLIVWPFWRATLKDRTLMSYLSVKFMESKKIFGPGTFLEEIPFMQLFSSISGNKSHPSLRMKHQASSDFNQ